MKRSGIERKTPMKRTSILTRKPAGEAKPAKGPRPKKCANKACRAEYLPDPKRPWENWCGENCALVIALDKLAIKKAKDQRAERAEDKKKLDGFKNIPTLIAEAQVVFNTWVRMRDDLAGHACICCGKMPLTSGALHGGQWDACHYRSRGSAGHLRFDERNAHRGLKDCNTYGHTDYRGGLIKRIGLEAVEALEAENEVRKWTREYLIGVKKEYAARCTVLRKQLKERT